MGYVPPPPGSVMILERGFELMEITCIDDPRPRFIKLDRSATVEDFEQSVAEAVHRRKMEAMHAETLRHARITTALLLMLPFAIIGAVADLAGWI